MKLSTTRYLNGAVRAYKLSDSSCGPLEPAASYPIHPNDGEVLDQTVSPDFSQAVYATSDTVACVSETRSLIWRYNFEPHSTQRYSQDPSCRFSLDGMFVWVYRPDAMADRGPDMLVILHAKTGAEVARTELDSVGHVAQFALHPDGRHILLDVGEGQDGVKIFRAALTADGASIDLHTYAWRDRCLIDLAPDGRTFMTVDHGRDDVAFHEFPAGEVIFRLPLVAFGYGRDGDGDDDDGDDDEEEEEEEEEEQEAFFDWSGGFLDSDIAVVTITGEKDGKEWHHHHQVSLRTGMPLGRFEAYSRDSYDIEPLGGSSWIVSDTNGNPILHRLVRGRGAA